METHDDELHLREKYVAHLLKDHCYVRGVDRFYQNAREKDPVVSSKYIHELAKIYEARSPDKQCLAQSAVLYKAATLRDPSNSLIKNDLQQLCAKLLKLADADNKNADLMDASRNLLESIDEMRRSAKAELETLKHIQSENDEKKLRENEKRKIEAVEKIQEKVSDDYSAIMNSISEYCVGVMGPVPCKYTVAGMGSLARREVTPYSDFENIIVLEDKVKSKPEYRKALDYFRWFALIFQFVIIGFGETIIRFAAIPSLNDKSKENDDWFYDTFTTCGISPDGFEPHACKNPLGRQRGTAKKSWTTELIKPVSDMVKYLKSDEDLKNGYYLADILTKTCYVSGNREVYQRFYDKVKGAGEKEKREHPQRFFRTFSKQIGKYIDEFGTIKKLRNLGRDHNATNFNMKNTVYRSMTIFISSLGKLYNLDARSCFEVIRELRDLSLIDSDDAHKLTYGIAVACEVRLKVYTNLKGQNDFINRNPNALSDQHEADLFEQVGEKSIIDYFLITYALQDAVKSLIEPWKEGQISERMLLRNAEGYTPMIYFTFSLYKESMKFIESDLFKTKSLHYGGKAEHDMFRMSELAENLFRAGKTDAALKMFREVLALRIHLSVDNSTDRRKLMALYQVDLGSLDFDEYANASSPASNNAPANNFSDDLKVYKDVAAIGNPSMDDAACLNSIAYCLKQKNLFTEAIQHFQLQIKMLKEMTPTEAIDNSIDEALFQIGMCHHEDSQYKEALKYFEEYLELKRTRRQDHDVFEMDALEILINDCKSAGGVFQGEPAGNAM